MLLILALFSRRPKHALFLLYSGLVPIAQRVSESNRRRG
jgi:hypothetical protein